MLRTIARAVSMLVLVALVACSAPQAAPASEPERALRGELMVFAAASLTDAFSAIAIAFEAEHAGTTVRFSFAGSQQLAAQLVAGAPADLFASADVAQMAIVKEDGRITTGSEQIFARNRLVIVAPADNPAGLEQMADLARPGLRLVLADQAVPAGRYTHEILEQAAGLPAFGPGYRAAVLANVVSFEHNVRAVLAKVSLGEADAGIVYLSDARASSAPLQEIAIPTAIERIAEYPLAVLNDSTKEQLAHAFVAFVLGPQGQAILEEYGFE